MVKNKEHISREAHDTSKGFRLQKLRAVELMIDSEKLSDSTVMFWAIEYQEDVYQSTDGDELIEEDKSYAESTSFTFNSTEIKKALVSFIDIWVKYEYSPSIRFNFYSSNKIGKEKSSSIITSENIELPDGKMIDLASKETLSSEFIEASKKFVLHALKEQYGTQSNKYETVSKWKNTNWEEFFKLITWKFEQPNEESLDGLVIEKIKKCRWFSSAEHIGKEEFIKARLIDLLDARQNKPDFFKRIVSRADVQLIFGEAKSGSNYQKNDPIWEMWNTIPSPTDKRTVTEKLLAKWANVEEKDIERFRIKAVEGGIERRGHESENDFRALRYRVYRTCANKLELIIKTNQSYSTPDDCIDFVFKEVKKDVADLSKTYSYSFDSDILIYNIVLELVDSCYLAFDGE